MTCPAAAPRLHRRHDGGNAAVIHTGRRLPPLVRRRIFPAVHRALRRAPSRLFVLRIYRPLGPFLLCHAHTSFPYAPNLFRFSPVCVRRREAAITGTESNCFKFKKPASLNMSIVAGKGRAFMRPKGQRHPDMLLIIFPVFLMRSQPAALHLPATGPERPKSV